MNKIKVYPGDTALTFYIAKNTSDHAISGISTYHVTPAKVGIYFNKIQCFCFEEQRLKPNESIEMPVLFFLDADFKTDPKMQDVESITLSYTFYKSDFS
jgi:cytochrome c oxidase assembly protein subunit 11